MDKTNDSIIFESRAEIGAVLHALETWEDDHPRDKDRETVSRMIELLDVMGMSW